MTYFINSKIINNSFTEAFNSEFFVDKSLLINDLSKNISTYSKFLCITRPRRFGKTINAMMLECYYSKNANFKELFDKLNISKCESYEKHLNKHNVIYIQLNELPGVATNVTYADFINRYKNLLFEDIKELWPDVKIDKNAMLSDVFSKIFSTTGEGFIFIIDEWDFIFNNNLFSKQDRDDFLLFLKDLLKDRPYVELCYMTGVLPIAKYSTGSSLNMFREYNFLNDDKYYKYFGFTTEEVENICSQQSKITMNELKDWYDGYKIQGIDIYNPRSVVSALSDGSCKSYWTNTGPMDEIAYHINLNLDGLKEDIIRMISGESIPMRLLGYGAECIDLNTREEILSAMTVYGFLTYHDDLLEIPNKELKIKYYDSIRDKNLKEISKLLSKSFDLLQATIHKNIDKMVEIIEYTHQIYTSIIKYNDENSLACILTIAYISAIDNYRIVREMPTGIGFADFIFYSKSPTRPSFIIELKRDVSAQDALKQIFEKHYDNCLKDLSGEKLAIGISYNSKSKKHSISIDTFL